MFIFAYIDPGTGLLVWQAIVAACLGGLFYLKKTRAWLLRQLRRPFRSSKSGEPVTVEFARQGDEERR